MFLRSLPLSPLVLLVLRLVLFALFCVSPVPLCAQDGTETGDADGRVQDPADVAAEENARAARPRLAPSVPIYVRVLQDPIRIAPGESGLILLHVQIPGDGSVDVYPGGTSKHAATQQVLRLGVASFDPPPAGATKLRSMLVRLPVSVDSKAKYGSYDVVGSLELQGRFGGSVPGGDESADGQEGAEARVASIADGSNPAGVVHAPTVTNQASVPWAGRIVVGAPVPKAAPRNATPRVGTGSGAADSSQVSGQPGETEPDSTAPNAKTEKPLDVGVRADSGSKLDGGFDPQVTPSSDGTVFLVVLAAGAVLLLLFFVLQARSKAH